MHLHEEAPPLNPWPFLAGDVVLIATACLISSQTQAPLAGLPLVAVAGCVALGAMLAITPYLLNYTRRQDLALTERQREIAALAQTTATSAEQISIAAASLHGIAENTARSLKLADQLPHKMQEKLNDFKAQLNEVAVTDNEALSQELNTLRTSETERLETALANVRKTAADLAQVEASSRKHLTDLNESLTHFVSAAEKAVSNATSTIAEALGSAEKSLVATQASATGAIQDTIAAAFAEFDRRIAALAKHSAEQTAHSAEAPVEAVTLSPAIDNGEVPTKLPKTSKTIPPFEAKRDSTPPVASAEAKPIAIASSDRPETASPTEEKPARKRPARKAAIADNELTLGIEMPSDDFSQATPEDSTPAVSADGLTRLLVTAYIGIGNKLYVRGDGPGLTWDRGLPLQFVSIGKWRWESADVTAPVTLKLYKNDELECTAVGPLTLAPGHQQEVMASFN